MKFLYIILTIIAGCVLPLQGTINGKLGRNLGSPVYASFASFLVGTVVLFLYSLTQRPVQKMTSITAIPAYEWLGGLFGAFYVVVVIVMLPELGAALTFSLLVAGQMVISLLLDHTGWLVPLQHAITFWRVVGLVMIVARRIAYQKILDL